MGYEAKQPVDIPVADFLELEFYLMDVRPGVKTEAFIAELVNRWLKTELERRDLKDRGHSLRGFQWKSIFLPEGTNLRTSYCSVIEFAKVVGDRIVAEDGAMLTPSQFANRRAKGRNAWRFVWLRFPGDDYWIRAEDRRLRCDDLLSKQSKTRGELSKAVSRGGPEHLT
ncbi:hypothetical protein [Pseudoduganella sp. R-34]|uniref:hypothetical protein n=1 Tax=Pseudoduganella sp. R-34 TaxID=3404062 RepID=UPI003CF557FB